MTRTAGLSCLFLPALVLAAAAAQTNRPAAGVVQVIVTYQDYDPLLPWRKLPPATRQGYAAVIGSSRALTTENLVRRATLVEILCAESGDKMPASIETRDHQANLALLKIAGDAAPNAATSRTGRMTPLAIAERVARSSAVTIVQFDETGQIQQGSGDVIQTCVGALDGAMNYSLMFKVLTELNVNGEGAAVLQNDKLAGLVMSYDRGTRTAGILPSVVLDRFLKDVAEPPYEGFASAGFTWTGLTDPAKRAYLDVRDPDKGILVLSSLPGGDETGKLSPNDVIFKWDGFAIDNLGFYEDPEFGRLSMPHLIKGRRKPGDVVPVTIVRDRRTMDVQAPLSRFSDETSLVPENNVGEPEEYLVAGGCVIRELTGLYLRARGPNWRQATDPRLMHLYLTRRFMPEQPGDRVVILSVVLPDSINIGYQHFRDAIVATVNGQPVRSLRDVFRVVDADGRLERLGLRSCGVELVLDPAEMASADTRLARLYRVPQLRRQRAK
ncbi:MAG: hypothetical protein QME60_07245 [Verrucomicrobiota bacterium]|nr:hypothetical protein [Verrucomicrobiota bacterium]